MTDYKQLCAELVAWAEKTSAHYYSQPRVLLRARAALAEPEDDVHSILRLAEIIREVDGSNNLSAAALAEAILNHPNNHWGK